MKGYTFTHEKVKHEIVSEPLVTSMTGTLTIVARNSETGVPKAFNIEDLGAIDKRNTKKFNR